MLQLHYVGQYQIQLMAFVLLILCKYETMRLNFMMVLNSYTLSIYKEQTLF